jgi:uncharacterized protein YuzE
MIHTISCDHSVRAVYIRLTPAQVHATIPLAKGVFLDVDASGQVIGFEILHADAALLARIPASPDPVDLAALLRGSAA